MRFHLAALGLAAALAGSAAAADAAGNFFIMGDPGAMSCETLLTKTSDEKAGFALGVWVAGYVTALNRTTPDTYHLAGNIELSGLFQALLDHCTKNPKDLVETAVYATVESLYDKRQKAAP